MMQIFNEPKKWQQVFQTQKNDANLEKPKKWHFHKFQIQKKWHEHPYQNFYKHPPWAYEGS